MTLTWTEVANAVAYRLEYLDEASVGHTLGTFAERTFDVNPINFNPGIVMFRVRAIAADGSESAWSNLVPYTFLAAPVLSFA